MCLMEWARGKGLCQDDCEKALYFSANYLNKCPTPAMIMDGVFSIDRFKARNSEGLVSKVTVKDLCFRVSLALSLLSVPTTVPVSDFFLELVSIDSRDPFNALRSVVDDHNDVHDSVMKYICRKWDHAIDEYCKPGQSIQKELEKEHGMKFPRASDYISYFDSLPADSKGYHVQLSVASNLLQRSIHVLYKHGNSQDCLVLERVFSPKKPSIAEPLYLLQRKAMSGVIEYSCLLNAGHSLHKQKTDTDFLCFAPSIWMSMDRNIKIQALVMLEMTGLLSMATQILGEDMLTRKARTLLVSRIMEDDVPLTDVFKRSTAAQEFASTLSLSYIPMLLANKADLVLAFSGWTDIQALIPGTSSHPYVKEGEGRLKEMISDSINLENLEPSTANSQRQSCELGQDMVAASSGIQKKKRSRALPECYRKYLKCTAYGPPLTRLQVLSYVAAKQRNAALEESDQSSYQSLNAERINGNFARNFSSGAKAILEFRSDLEKSKRQDPGKWPTKEDRKAMAAKRKVVFLISSCCYNGM